MANHRLAYINTITQTLNEDKWTPIQGPIVFDNVHSTGGTEQELENAFGIKINSSGVGGIINVSDKPVFLNMTAYIAFQANDNWNTSIGFALFNSPDFTTRPVAAGSYGHPRNQPNTATISLQNLPPLAPGSSYFFGLDNYTFNQWQISSIGLIFS